MPPKLDAGAWLRPICGGRDWNRIAGSWKQLEGKVKAKWGLLTDDDLMTINGSRELFVGKIQERYGIAKDEARKQVDEYFTSQGY